VLLTFPRQTVEDPARQGMWRSTALGVRYVRFTRPIRVLLGVTALFALTTASVQALLPVVDRRARARRHGFGLLYGLFGTGALLAVATRERGARPARSRRMLPGSITGFGTRRRRLRAVARPAIAGAALLAAGLFWVWTLTT
jgi:hypothetical protein